MSQKNSYRAQLLVAQPVVWMSASVNRTYDIAVVLVHVLVSEYFWRSTRANVSSFGATWLSCLAGT